MKNFLEAAKISSGKYIRGIGQGDMFFDEYTLRDQCEDFVKTGASVSGTNYVSFRKFSAPIKLVKSWRMPQDLEIFRHGTPQQKKYSLVVNKNYIHGPTLIYKREVLLKYLQKFADFGIRYTEDVVTWLMAALEDDISFYDRYTVFYEVGVGFGGRHLDLLIKDHARTLQLIIDSVKDKDPDFVRTISEVLNEMQRNQHVQEKRVELKKKLGILTPPLLFMKHTAEFLMSFFIKEPEYKLIKTATDAPTDFANLCINRE